jgi:hypothetical protein
MFAIGHGVQDSRLENLARAEGERRRWPIDVDELWVPMKVTVAGGCFMGESINGARIHQLSPSWRINCRCFVD